MTATDKNVVLNDLRSLSGLREPCWIWDHRQARIVWANSSGLVFWNEHDLEKLKARNFDHSMPGVQALLALFPVDIPEQGITEQFLFWTEKGPRNVECVCLPWVVEEGIRGLLLRAVTDNHRENYEEFQVDLADQSVGTVEDVDTTFHNSLASPEDQETLREIARLLADPETDESEEESEQVREHDVQPVEYRNGELKSSSVEESFSVSSMQNEQKTSAIDETSSGNTAQHIAFLAKISHEVRTPLNSIIGFAELMRDETYGPLGHQKYREYIGDILGSSYHALSLINDLLDIARVEAGEFPVAPTSLDLNSAVENCISSLQPQTGQARLVIRQSLSPNLPRIMADQRSLRQIILNLLSNAIRFTAAGGQIIVSTQALDRDHVRLRVRDTGIGMSEEDLQVAMQPFGQLDNGLNGMVSGTGLGLPLTRALAEANRAAFHISSKEGKGTLVEVTFPGKGTA